MARSRPHEMDFGSDEKLTRLIEETEPQAFASDLERRLTRYPKEDGLAWIRAAALAAARSVRHEGAGRFPHGMLVLPSAREFADELLASGDAAGARRTLSRALIVVNEEVHSPAFGPFRLLDCEPVPGEGREGTLFAFLEAARAGETGWADHRFAWLVRNLEKEQVVDLLLSSGLEGVTADVHRVAAVVEAASLLQAVGWELAPLLLRPAARRQAAGSAGEAEYDRCRELVTEMDLLHRARRRPPGQVALGEEDPEGFFVRALQWAEADPASRSHRVATALAEGVPLEDVADLISAAATLLFLQETLRPGSAVVDALELERRVHLVTGVAAMRQLVRLGTPGQRILGLLLAGWVPPVREAVLAPRSPDCGWWLAPASRLVEPVAASDAPVPAPPAWQELIGAGQLNGLLPLLTERLEGGVPASGLEGPLAGLAAAPDAAPGLSILLQRSFIEAYRQSRSRHRWIHFWAAGLALSGWPKGDDIRGLRAQNGPATLPA